MLSGRQPLVTSLLLTDSFINSTILLIWLNLFVLLFDLGI